MIKDIDVKNVSVKIGKTTIIKDVSVSIERSKIIAIVGSSGGGKSTLARCLTGQLKPYIGGGTVLGYDIIKETRQIQRHIGYIPQDDRLNMYPTLSAIDNIRIMGSMFDPMFFSSKKGTETIHEVLDILNIDETLRSIPTKNLSGGERKRVSIAMGIIIRPQLLFLDEPTTGLDEHLKNNIFNYLKKINKVMGITTCIVTHNLPMCEMVDEIVILKKGMVVECGDPKMLLKTLPSNGITIKVRFEWSNIIEKTIKKLNGYDHYLYIGRNLYKFFCPNMPRELHVFVQGMYELGLEPRSIILDDANLLDYFLLRVK